MCRSNLDPRHPLPCKVAAHRQSQLVARTYESIRTAKRMVVCLSNRFVRCFSFFLKLRLKLLIRKRFLLGYLSCDRKYLRPAIVPKSLGDLQCINIKILPPRDFITSLMQLSMMAAAERRSELIADFEA